MSGETVEAVRRIAQQRADFWFEQAAKSEYRREHYEVVASQFQYIANLLRSITVELPEAKKTL